MGRIPTPTSLKVLRGNPGQRPINTDEPKPPAADLTPPARLDGPALEKWEEIAPLLASMGVFTQADRGIIERYCLLWEQWLYVVKHVKEHGMTQMTQTGYSQLSAEGTLFKSLPAELMKIEIQFGMTAAARSTLKVSGASAPDDPLEAYIKSRGD
jgi:P27 family predicted phage terminase small subunit